MQEKLDILNQLDIKLESLSTESLLKILSKKSEASELTDDDLIEFLEVANLCYRTGDRLISDADYDFIFLAELEKRHPQHPLLERVEPEPEAAFVGKTITLPERMLSTDKAYTMDQIEKWFKRLAKAADEINVNADDLIIHITPKLDGFAAYDDGEKLYTRGNGFKGTDVTRVFTRGLLVGGNGQRGQGPGEIVIDKLYFKSELTEHFENSRNVQAAILAEKNQDEHIDKAIESGAAVFYPFKQLPNEEVSIEFLRTHFESIIERISNTVPYDIDGVIFEVTHEELKQAMGHTRHHHRWQIAFKSNLESADVEVLSVIPQTSRTGRVNPVVELVPTHLSGVTISKVSAHHYNMVKQKGIGPGAIINLVRSGLVIPKIEHVLQQSEPEIATNCPSCDSTLEWDSDYLFCPNRSGCAAQLEHTVEHFFRTLGNIDGFGPKTIQVLFQNNVHTIIEIYNQNVDDFISMGFGDKTSENLIEQLNRSRLEKIEDWRFLSAFGLVRLGQGNCEKLLQNFPLESVFDLEEPEIADIEGFAEKTSQLIVSGLKSIKSDFDQLFALNFNLEKTPLLADNQETTPITGKLIVFSGKMTLASRKDMEKTAKQLGAKTGKSVTSKTDFLVIGENVGASKTAAAEKHGVNVLTEDEYQKLIHH